MGSLFSYGAIATKIRSMQADLLSDNEYRELAMQSSIPEAVAFLRRQPAYQSLLSDVDESKLHRGQIEKLLRKTIQQDFSKLYRFADADQRKFLNMYFERYEVATLKTFLRMLFNQKGGAFDISSSRIIFEKHSQIDIAKLSTASTIEEFVSFLRETPYYPPLIRLESMTSPTLFDYELALDIYYFTHIWDVLPDVVKGRELKDLKVTYGGKIDLLNIQWIYRSKFYYHMSAADIYALIIPVSYRLKKEQLVHLVESSDENEFTAVLKTTHYGKIYPQADSHTLEDMYIRLRDNMHAAAVRKNPYSAAVLDSYLYRKEHEINKITTALECIRYGLEPSETIKYIIK